MSCLVIPMTVQECDLVSMLRGRRINDGEIYPVQAAPPVAGDSCGTYPLANGQVWYSDGVTVVLIEDVPVGAHNPYVLTNLAAPFSHNTLAQTGNVPPPVSATAGNVITADANGSSFLDCAAILACVPVGHPAYVLTNNAAPFSHNTLLQTGNVPPPVSANAGNVIVADVNGSAYLDCAAINACVVFPAPTPNIAHGISRTDLPVNDFFTVQHVDELGLPTVATFALGCGLGKNGANEAIVNPTLGGAQANTLNTACVGDAVVPTFPNEASCLPVSNLIGRVGGVWSSITPDRLQTYARIGGINNGDPTLLPTMATGQVTSPANVLDFSDTLTITNPDPCKPAVVELHFTLIGEIDAYFDNPAAQITDGYIIAQVDVPAAAIANQTVGVIHGGIAAGGAGPQYFRNIGFWNAPIFFTLAPGASTVIAARVRHQALIGLFQNFDVYPLVINYKLTSGL